MSSIRYLLLHGAVVVQILLIFLCDLRLLDLVEGQTEEERTSEMAKSECALCRGKRSEFVCAQCASDMLQQRRTMLAALQADVAVLRHKTEASLGVRNLCSPSLHARTRLR